MPIDNMKKNIFALLFVLLTQTACATFYAMDVPASYGPRDAFFKVKA